MNSARATRTSSPSTARATPVATARPTHAQSRGGLSQAAPPVYRLSPTPGGGEPLAASVQAELNKTLKADTGAVRIHADAAAAEQAKTMRTRAFTLGTHIYLGAGERPTDLGLVAHEVAHVLQQRSAPMPQRFSPRGASDHLEMEAQSAAAAVERGEPFTVRGQTQGPRIQGLFGIDLPNPLNWLADKANIIPGFRMFTIILGVNPINMSPVARSAANILRALIEFMPGGGLITQALDNSGVFDKAGAFVETQIAALGMTGSAIKTAVTAFISSLSPSDILHLGDVWERAKRIFTEPIDRIISFAKGLVTGIIQLIKDAILKPIAKLAEGTEGYNLLKGILGKDPITGEAVPRSPETLLGPLLRMIGLGDIWQRMQETKAISRCWTWFQSTIGQLFAIVSQIPSSFIAAFKSLTLEDIILIPKAFIKLGKVFLGFVGKFVTWGLTAMWNLLEIIFDVVSPGAFGYIKKTGAALKSILKNPLPFVGNLAKAAMLGFTNFAGNILTHLKKGLIDWLTGSLEGVYIPKALTLIEFGKLALSVLGVSWAQIRAKIVKALGPSGETIMKGLETAFDIVKALVTGGPAAAWEVIKDKLTGLKDQIVSGIISFVIEAIVTKAVPKLIAMFIPGAGFISAIISIYDMVMVFVQKISKIIQVVTAFINSIVAIAAGNIGAAAAKVESILGGLLSLALSFLAGFVGLGKVAGKVMAVINKIRAVVDKALDTAINFIIGKAKALFARLFGGEQDKKQDPEHDAKVKKGLAQIDALDASYSNGGKITRENAEKVAAKVKSDNPVFKSIQVVEGPESWDFDYVASPGNRYKGASRGSGQLKVTSVTIKNPEQAKKVERAMVSGAAWELAIQTAVVKEILVPRWEIIIRVPIEIVFKGQKQYQYPSREDLARLKVQRGHRAGTQKGFPEVTMEVKKPAGGGDLQEVRVVEITLVEDFTGQGDFAQHKVDQFTRTVGIFKEKYGTSVPIKYYFLTPRPPKAETKDFIVGTLQSQGVPNITVIWVVVKTK